jgi:hypothetical protein
MGSGQCSGMNAGAGYRLEYRTFATVWLTNQGNTYACLASNDEAMQGICIRML